MTSRTRATAIIVAWCLAGELAAGDWPRFRGPDGSGISDDTTPMPITWSESEHLRWKLPLPGPGVSSPIVVGSRVFVTCYSGYGLDRDDPGNMDDLQRHLLCVDSDTGRLMWEQTVAAVLPEDPFTGIGVTSHGYASHTPVSDGERVYAFFGKSGALAFDMNGQRLWQASVGTESDPWGWGSAASPIVYGDRLIVTAAAESQSIVGLDCATGDEVWRQEATHLDGVWGTPTVVEVDQRRTDIVLGVPQEIWGFNPTNGKLRWFASAMETDQFQSSVVVDNGVAYAIEGRGGGSIAVRVGGKGDVTDSQVVWTGNDASRFGTPIVYDGRIDADTGEAVYKSRLQSSRTSEQGDAPDRGPRRRGRAGRGGFRGGGDYASPVIADGKLYYVQGTGDTHVVKLGDRFEQLAVNRVTNDSESFGATPAISDGRLFLRSNKHLYCVAND